MENAKIVVGLGNPGLKYEATRHNIGFLVVDELAQRQKLSFSINRTKYFASEEGFQGNGLVLLKPLTYMNLSGEAVVAWAERSSVSITGISSVEPVFENDEDRELFEPPEGVRPLVICDDLALPLGAVRLRGKGSSGGQNGIQSIIDHLDGDEFPRLRLGIAPADKPVSPEFWPDFVLAEFEPEERDLVKDVISHAADTIEFWLENTLEKTASQYNRRKGLNGSNK